MENKEKKETEKKTKKTTSSKKEAVVKISEEEKKVAPVVEEVEEDEDDEEIVFTPKKEKSLGSIVWGILLLIVLVAVFIIGKVTVRTYFTEVNYNKYEKVLSNDESIVYVGNNEDEIKTLTELAKSKKLDIYYLNSDKLTDEEKNAVYDGATSSSKLIIKNDNNEIVYSNEYTTTKITSALVDAGILSKGIQTVKVSEYLNIIKESGYHFMFVGSETCSWCQKFKPELEKVVEEYNLNAYYVDLSTVTQDEYNALVASNTYFTENQWGTPTSFIYKDGESLTVISGYKDAANITSILKEYKVID